MVAVYNMFMFGIIMFAPKKLSYLFLAIEAVICTFIITAIALQSPYIPMVPEDCGKHAATVANGYFKALAESKLKTWKPGKDSDGNKKKPPTPYGCCYDLYLIFAFEMTML